MKKYMLISVFDREIFTEQFDTEEEAQAMMHKEMVEQGGISEDIFSEKEYEDDEVGFGFGEDCAWVNNGFNNADLDWRIIAL